MASAAADRMHFDMCCHSNSMKPMKISITLDDELAERFRAEARERGQCLSVFLADAGRLALAAKKNSQEPFEVLTCGEGGAYPGINLDKISELLGKEDEQRYRKESWK